MKRIAIADIHLSAYKDDPITEFGLPQRLSDIIQVIKMICNFAKKNEIYNIDILGDLYHDKNVIFTDAQNAFKDVIISYPDITFNIISGNHDLSSTGDSQTSAISAFEGYSNVICYTNMTKIDNVTIIPYSKHMLEDVLESNSNDIMLGHFGLTEAQLSSGLSIVSDIKMKHLSKFKLVLLGHYHKPQKIENDDTTLFYVGNPIHRDWNDKNDKKRFLVYDTETLEVTSLPLKGFVEYREFEITESTDVKTLLSEVADLKEKGHKVKIKNLTKNNMDSFKNSGIVVLEECQVDITQRGILGSMSTIDKLKKYLKINDIVDDEEKYLKIAKKFTTRGL